MASHGDFQKYLDRLVQLPINLSEEDMNVIDDHPEYLRITSEMMIAIDKVEMLGE